MKFPDWITNLIPASWSWQVAAKKVSYMAGKAVAAILTYKQAAYINAHLSPDQQAQLQVAAGAFVAAAIEAIHDALKLKYPDAKWL